MLPLILASASPRRSALLQQLGVNFQVVPSPIDESKLQLEGSPANQVQESARAKGIAVARLYPGYWVLSADTVVCVDDQILGKPKDALDAQRMLGMLQGRCHKVLTGMSLMQTAEGRTAEEACIETVCEETLVWMAALTPEEIKAYVATKEPMDKAGAYAIQAFGSSLIPKIQGCYFNVMGLPVYQAAQLLKKAGIPIWQAGAQ
jgi:septum formation protein